MTTQVELWETLDDWFSLMFGRNSASVEGTADQWRAALACLTNGSDIYYTRLAVQFDDQGRAHLWSPRNAWGGDDEHIMEPSDIAPFVERATAALELAEREAAER